MAQHKDLTGADLHIIKGADVALIGTVPISNGAGDAPFATMIPKAAIYFVNTATPYTLTYPATATKVAVTSIAVGATSEFTAGLTGRITYIGTTTLYTRVLAKLSVDQSIGADRDLEFYVYKNGVLVTGSTSIQTTQTGKKESIILVADVELATNDYVEVFVKNNGVSGDINVYTYYLAAFSMRG